MSKYTTQVRYICENNANATESTGADNIEYILDKSWHKIFTTKTPFFDESYREVICKKILKHYYLREICCETVGIWKLWVNTKLEEIMPYYNQLYKSQLLEFDPFNDVNLTTSGKRDKLGEENFVGKNVTTGETTKKDITFNNINSNYQKSTNNFESTDIRNKTTGETSVDDTTTDTGTNDVLISNTKKDAFSDTPEGYLSGVEDNTYLTTYEKITETGFNDTTVNLKKVGTSSGSSKEDIQGSTSTSGNGGGSGSDTVQENGGLNSTDNISNTIDDTKKSDLNTTEDYIETIIGKRGGQDYSTLLNTFRETFLNIDMMIIDEFDELFFGLW